LPISRGCSVSPVFPLSRAMKKSVIYAVYAPSVFGLPYLAVTLAADGTAKATPFDTAEDAGAFNKLMAMAKHPGGKARI